MNWRRLWPLYLGLFVLAAALSAWLKDHGGGAGTDVQDIRFTVLPVCAAGRTDWVASVRVDVGASGLQADFPFAVEP